MKRYDNEMAAALAMNKNIKPGHYARIFPAKLMRHLRYMRMRERRPALPPRKKLQHEKVRDYTYTLDDRIVSSREASTFRALAHIGDML